MTFRGTAPQSISSATSTLNWSLAIICLVPPIAAVRSIRFISWLSTLLNTRANKSAREQDGNAIEFGNIVGAGS